MSQILGFYWADPLVTLAASVVLETETQRHRDTERGTENSWALSVCCSLMPSFRHVFDKYLLHGRFEYMLLGMGKIVMMPALMELTDSQKERRGFLFELKTTLDMM